MSLARKVAVNTSALTAGRLALGISGLIGTVVATRYLGVEAYGALAVGSMVISILMTFGDGGVFTIVAREVARAPDDEPRLLANTLGLGLVLTALAVVGTLAMAQLVYGGPDRVLIREAIAILGLQLVPMAAVGTATAHLTAHQRMKPVAAASLASAVGFLAALACVIAFDLGFAGIAVAYTVGGLVMAAPILVLIRAGLLRPAADLALWRRLLLWAAPQGAIIVLAVVLFRIDSVLLSLVSTEREVAYYGLAYKVVEFLILLPALFVITLFPVFARARGHSEELAGTAQAAFTILQLGAVLIVVVFLALAPEIIAVVASPDFAPAVGPLRLLVLSLAPVYLGTLFYQACIALSEQRRLLYLMVSVLFLNVGLNLALIPAFGASGSAAIVVLSQLIVLAGSMYIFRAWSRLPRVFRLPQTLAAALGALGAIELVRLAGNELGLPALITVVVGGAAGAAAYGAVLYLLRSIPGEVEDLLGSLAGRFASRAGR